MSSTGCRMAKTNLFRDSTRFCFKLSLGETRHERKEICCGSDRHVLADICGMRQRRYRRGVSASRHRSRRRVTGVRAERRDDGLCDRTCFRLSPQSCRDRRPGCRRPLPGGTDIPVHHRASDWSRCCCRAALCDSEWRCRIRCQQRFCIERLWRAFTRAVTASSRASSWKS